MLRALASLLAAAVLSGCAHVTLDYPAEIKPRTVYNSGTPYFAQFGKSLGVEIGLPTERFSSNFPDIQIYVTAMNVGKTPFNFGTENISATVNGKKLRIFTYEELAARERHAAAMMALATGLNAASASLRANMPTTTYGSGTFSGGGYRNPYGVSGSYSGQTTTYNPAASSAASAAIQSNASNQIANIAATRDQNIAVLKSEALRTTTLQHKGQTVSGVVYIKFPPLHGPRPRIMNVTFSAAGDTLTFPVELK
ncbi:hypothetical protein DB345_05550 [Spartobacteria bacterium LR76]|nr:hypothetical protein DB345_05550 [Spartobacteria bacterium LR76]